MKRLLFLSLIFFAMQSDAQILKRIADRTKQKTENKVAEKVSEKVSDAATKPIDEAGQKKKKKEQDSPAEPGDGTDKGSTSTTGNPESTDKPSLTKEPDLATYSKFDFVPGEKILVAEDFSQDAIGDFPVKWNTNASGEVVKAAGMDGHWLMIKKKGRYIPEHIKDLPENFTLQFDLMCNDKFSNYSKELDILILTGNNDKRVFEYSFIPYEKRSGVKIGFHPSDAGLK